MNDFFNIPNFIFVSLIQTLTLSHFTKKER